MSIDRDDRFDRSDRDRSDRNDRSDDLAVSDAELVRFLDGELADADLGSLGASVAASPEIAERLDTLRRRSDALSALLADVDPDQGRIRERAAVMRRQLVRTRRPPATWGRMSPALRAAAVIALLLVGAFAVPPARAWVVDRVRDVVEALGLAGPPASAGDPGATAPAGPDGPAGADMSVTFNVPGDTFEIHLTAPAVIVVERATGATGSAEGEAGPDGRAAGPAFVVLPGALRIDAAAPGTTVRVTLPPSVTAVRVRGADASVAVHPLPGVGQTLRIEPPGP